MIETSKNVDLLTNLYNMKKLRDDYNPYLSSHPNAKVIAIDFAKLKYINDNYGHGAGDQCLKSFGYLIRQRFPDSLLIRRSGDEFVIVTSYPPRQIESKLEATQDDIYALKEQGLIPVAYSFNSGIVDADKDLDSSLQTADIIMYDAKSKEKLYAYYSKEVYDAAKKDERFLEAMGKEIEDCRTSFAAHQIYKVNGEPTHIYDLYSRDLNGDSFFTDHNYDLLRNSYKLKTLDLLNIERLLNIFPTNGDKTIINVHNQTILGREYDFLEELYQIQKKTGAEPRRFIFCVDVNQINGNANELMEKLDTLGSMGYGTGLNSYTLTDFSPAMSIWNNVPIDYLKIAYPYWTNSMNNTKARAILQSVLPVVKDFGTKPIFMKVETKEEADFIEKLYGDGYAIGHNYEEEEKLAYTLKKTQ